MTAKNEKWLNAFQDPLAGLYTFPTCISTADLHGDGDYKLVIADLGTGKYNMKLKVWKGVSLLTENALVDLPTAVSSFFMEQTDPRSPAIAVASGASVFIYKNLKPYYKFNLPSVDVNDTEKEIWQHVASDQLDTKALHDVLTSLKEQITVSALTARSQRYLMLEESHRQEFIETQAHDTLKKQSIITCISTMKKSSMETNSIDCLVLGCEDGRVLCVDAEAFTALTECRLPSAPVFLHSSGLYDVEYRILVCCRDGCVYTVKRNLAEVTQATIELSSHAVGLTRVAKHIYVACMDQTLRTYSLKGKKTHSLSMPATITALEAFSYEAKQYYGVLVALSNKEIHLYQDQFLVDVMVLDDVPTSIRFGRFGREEGALIIVTRVGGLTVKLFKRTAKLNDGSKGGLPGPPAGQTQKLNVPKKTKVFVDQTIRERDEAQRMHQIFQRDLFLLRLHVAEAYTKMLDSKLTPVSFDSDEMLKLSAQIQGFGPTFLMIIYLQTMSVQAVTGLSIMFQYNGKLYEFEKNVIPVGLLVPGVQYTFKTKISCLMPDTGLADDVKVFVIRESKSTPLLTAVVTMPVSEQSLID